MDDATTTSEQKGMIVRRALLALTISAGLLAAGNTTASATGPERADVMEQDGLTVLAPDGAQLVRQANGIAVSVKMPAPEPGSYEYPPNPPGIEPGHPEVFTLWAFVLTTPRTARTTCVAGTT